MLREATICAPVRRHAGARKTGAAETMEDGAASVARGRGLLMNLKRMLLIFVVGMAFFTMGGAQAADQEAAYYWSQGKKIYVDQISGEYIAIYQEAGKQQTLLSEDDKGSGYTIEEPPIRVPVNVSYLRKVSNQAAKSASLARSGQVIRSIMPAMRDRSSRAYVLPMDTVVVRFKNDISGDRAIALLEEAGLTDAEESEYASNQFVARYPGGGMGVFDAANKLYEGGEVVFCHPDMVVEKRLTYTPNDPFYTYQWHLNNTGQSGGIPGADINIEPAWDITRGSHSTAISVADDGIMWTHEDLSANYLGGYDFGNYDTDPTPSGVLYSTDSHGTAVTGLMAGKGSNGIGVTGSCPDCGYYAAAFGDRFIDDANMFYWQAEMGSAVSSNSWEYSNGGAPDVVAAAIADVTANGRNGLGMAVVAAAGNDDRYIASGAVAAQPNVITVGASTTQDLRAYYSNYGSSVDIMAPSSGLTTADITTTDVYPPVGSGYNPGGASGNYANGAYTNDFGGTSAATPIVAGVVGLMFDVNPFMTLEEAKRSIQFTADKVGPVSYTNGRNNFYGYGRLNAYNAVLSAVASQYTGWWYNRDSEGTGISIETQGLRLFVTWYAYDQLGKPLWLSSDGYINDSSQFSGNLYRWTGWPLGSAYSKPSQEPVGRISINFESAGAGATSCTATIDGVELNSAFDIIKFLDDKVGGDRDARDINGWWYDSSYNGMGWFLEARGGQLFLAWYNYRDDSSAVWWSSGGAFNPAQTVYHGELYEYANGPCFGCVTTTDPAQTSLGVVSVSFQSESQAILSWNGNSYTLNRFIFGLLD